MTRNTKLHLREIPPIGRPEEPLGSAELRTSNKTDRVDRGAHGPPAQRSPIPLVEEDTWFTMGISMVPVPWPGTGLMSIKMGLTLTLEFGGKRLDNDSNTNLLSYVEPSKKAFSEELVHIRSTCSVPRDTSTIQIYQFLEILENSTKHSFLNRCEERQPTTSFYYSMYIHSHKTTDHVPQGTKLESNLIHIPRFK